MPGKKRRPPTPIGMKSHGQIKQEMRAGKPFEPIRASSGKKGKPGGSKS